MADFKQEVTPANETTPSHSNLTSFSFRAEGILLTQSRGRLVVVNYFTRRLIIWSAIMLLSTIPLNKYFVDGFPPLSHWTRLFHHVTWQAVLSAVLPAPWESSAADLIVPLIFVMLYWLLVTGSEFNGVALSRRNGKVKVRGTTRLLTDVEAVRVVATRFMGKPDPSGRVWRVELLWSKTPEESLLGYFPFEADADRVAEAVAEFAGIPVRYDNRIK